MMGRLMKCNACMMIWAIFATLLSQTLVIPVFSSADFQDQKNFFHFPPYPYTGNAHPIVTTPPTGSTPSLPRGSGGGSHGTMPSHGSSHAPPATNCPNPPNAGHPTPTLAPPKSASSGGHDHHHSSPGIPSTPSTPISTPGIPSTPRTPGSVPTPPFDPKSPFTGTCNFWRNHPQYIVSIFGWWGSLGHAFGVTSVPGFGSSSHITILDLLSNNHRDGFGSLCREGTASLLNSMVNNNFPYSSKQVRDRFVASLSSDKAATEQANLFKLANQASPI